MTGEQSKVPTEYYRSHGILSDPRSQAALYLELPPGAPALARTVQGLLIPPYGRILAMFGVGEGEFDNARFGVRRAEDLLKRIQERRPGPLVTPRAPKDRIGAICRNFTFLQVSMLRHQGIPARSRVGFAGYLDRDGMVWWDHRVTEYWNESAGRWVLCDPYIDDVRKQKDGLSLDTLDLRSGGKFLVAGEAWRLSRAGGRDSDSFGDSPADRGFPPIRYALLHDLAYLNKVELLGNDDWGELLTKPEKELTQSDLAFLDHLAEVTVDPDANFLEVRRLYTESAYGRSVEEKVQALEAQAPRS